MNNRDKINYLKQYKRLDERIDRLLEEKEKWRTRAEKMSPTISDMPHGGNGENQIENAICKMLDCDREATKDIDKLVDLGREIKSHIEKMEDETLQLLLLYRYIDGHTFEEIAVKMNYSWRQVHRLHSDALMEFKMS